MNFPRGTHGHVSLLTASVENTQPTQLRRRFHFHRRCGYPV